MKKTLQSKICFFAVSVLFALMSTVGAFAQTKAISGKVVDASGEAVIGASVMVVGNNTLGTVTDIDGAYSLNVPAGATLSVSCIGYTTVTVSVGSESVYNVTLNEDSEFLEETVVVGYGVQKKSDVTGSVASVRGEDFVGRSTSDAATALQGKAAGVQILTNSGAPGQGSQIRVRGYSSNSGNIGPLLIVDGLKVNNIDYLDPQMIESMEILKDAASAAIYGAEAGNGVVLITTKSGASNNGQSSVNYSLKMTNQFLGKVDAYYTDAESYINMVRRKGAPIDADMAQYNYDGTSTNWFKETFEPTWSKQHSLTVQGGNTNGHFLVGLNYVDNNGIVKGDYDTHNRIGAQINADYKIYKWLTVGTNFSVSETRTKSVSQMANFGSLFGTVCQLDPLTPFYRTDPEDFQIDMYNNGWKKGLPIFGDENGYYATSKYGSSPGGHPFIQRDRNKNQYGSNLRINGTLYANVSPFKGFTFTSRFGVRYGNSTSHNLTTPFYATAASNGGYYRQYQITANVGTNYYYQWENFANYNVTLGKNSLGFMAGMSYIKSGNDNVNTSAQNADLLTGYEPNMQYMSYVKSEVSKTVTNAPGESASLAYFGRINYAYDNRYNAQVNFRADAFDSSKLSKQARWGFFPSFSAGWTISNESFFKDNVSRDAVSSLKVRASWGRNGNVNVLSGYQYASAVNYNSSWYQYQVDNGTFSLGSAPNGIANPDLKWETSDQIDLGLDARFLNNRLTFAADYFIKDTKDLLVEIPLPQEVGVSTVWQNAGSIRNTGIELELGWKDTIGDFSYSINTNFSYLTNKVTYLDERVGRVTASRGGVSGTDNPFHTVFEVGYPIWYFEAYKYNGVTADGGVDVEDVNGDGSISEADMTYIGSPLPDYTYGITLNMAYKGFDLTIFGTGVGGNDIFNCVSRAGDNYRNALTYLDKNSWSESNKNALYPDPAKYSKDWHFYGSSALMFSGAYFKIKQIQLGYTLPKNLTKKARISDVRLYTSLDDMITFTKYPGLDPETATTTNSGGMGIDAGSYPTMKKVLLGLSITF